MRSHLWANDLREAKNPKKKLNVNYYVDVNYCVARKELG